MATNRRRWRSALAPVLCSAVLAGVGAGAFGGTALGVSAAERCAVPPVTYRGAKYRPVYLASVRVTVGASLEAAAVPDCEDVVTCDSGKACPPPPQGEAKEPFRIARIAGISPRVAFTLPRTRGTRERVIFVRRGVCTGKGKGARLLRCLVRASRPTR